MDYFLFFYKTMLDYQVLVLMICQMCDFKNRFLTALNRIVFLPVSGITAPRPSGKINTSELFLGVRVSGI